MLNLVDGTDLAHLPLVQHGDARADAICAAHIVSDDNSRDAKPVAHAHHQFINDGAGDRIEAGGGLVVQDVFRAQRNGARDADPLAHSAGELGRKARFRIRQIHQIQRLGDAGGDLTLAQRALFTQSHGDVVADRERVEQRGELEDVADLRAKRREFFAIQVRDFKPVNFHAA